MPPVQAMLARWITVRHCSETTLARYLTRRVDWLIVTICPPARVIFGRRVGQRTGNHDGASLRLNHIPPATWRTT